jgi:hypothetical protein
MRVLSLIIKNLLKLLLNFNIIKKFIFVMSWILTQLRNVITIYYFLPLDILSIFAFNERKDIKVKYSLNIKEILY